MRQPLRGRRASRRSSTKSSARPGVRSSPACSGRWVYVEDADHPENYRLIRGTTDPAWDRPDRIAEVLLDDTGRYFWWRGRKVYLHGGAQ